MGPRYFDGRKRTRRVQVNSGLGTCYEIFRRNRLICFIIFLVASILDEYYCFEILILNYIVFLLTSLFLSFEEN